MPHEPMMCVSLIIGFLAACYGYGLVLCRLCAIDRSTDIGYTASAGIAVLVFFGGILNAVGWAFGWAIDALAGLGLVPLIIRSAALFRHRQDRSKFSSSLRMELLEPGLWVSVLALVFSAITIVPTTTFNPHDDLTQYLLRPLLMLQSGSLDGNWFDSTGADSMGAQSWMQAFFLNHLPITYTDVFDDIICFPLCCLVVIFVGRLLDASRLQRSLAALCIVVMDPVQVNTSSKYSQTLMVLGLIASLILFFKRYFGQEPEARLPYRTFWPVVLFGSAALALKFSIAPFYLALSLTILLATATYFRHWCDVAALTLVAALSIAITFGPWIAVFRTNYLAIFSAPSFPLAGPKFGTITPSVSYAFEQMISYDLVQFGQHGLVSTGFMLLSGGTALIAVFRLRRRPASCTPTNAISLAIIGISTVVFYLSGAFTFPWGVLRYAQPVFMAVVPVAVLYLLKGKSLTGGSMRLPIVAGTALLWGFILLTGARSLASRIDRAWTAHTALLFGKEPSFRASLANQFSSETAARVRGIQDHVPPGKKMLAAIIMPTDLNFERNPGYAMFLASLASPWFGELGGMTPADVRDYLMKLGVEYVLWQRSGEWVLSAQQMEEQRARSPNAMFWRTAVNFLAVYRALDLGMGPILYRSGDFEVIKLESSYQSAHFYRTGQNIDFTVGGSNPYRVSGWGSPEEPGTWTISKDAQLRFEFGQPPSSDLTLRADLTPYVVAQHPETSVAVEVDGEKVGVWRMTVMTPMVKCVVIPSHIVRNGVADVTLHIDAPAPPAAYGLSSDDRHLGVLIRSIILETGSGEKECTD
jgi:hypothetical protein